MEALTPHGDVPLDKEKLKSTILNYTAKNRQRTSVILQKFDNLIVLETMLDIIEENPCEIYYICSMLTTLGPICKSNLTVEELIQAVSSRNSVTVAHFIQVLLHDGIINADMLPDNLEISKFKHFQCWNSKSYEHSGAKNLLYYKNKLRQYKEMVKMMPPKEAKLLPGSPKRDPPQVSIPDEQHLVFNGLKCPDSNSLKAKVLECMHDKLEGKILSPDNAYLLKFVSATISLLDGKSLDVLNGCIPLYSTTEVKRFIKPVKDELLHTINNINEISKIIDLVYPNLESSELMYATLAGDAAQVYDMKEPNNLYCFEFLPLSSKLPVTPIHFKLLPKGAAPPSIKKLYTDIIAILEAKNIKILFIATDGEKALDTVHNEFFESHIASLLNHEFEKVIDSLSSGKYIPLSDILHLLKNARAHIINHKLYVDPCNLICVNKALMDEALEFSKCLTDTSREGKMKDGYAIELFSWKTLTELYLHGRNEAAFFILPFACMQEAIRSSCLSTDDRLHFLDIAYRCFRFHIQQIDSPLRCKGVTETFSKNSIGTTIGSRTWIVRCINTVLGIGKALKLHKNGVLPFLHLGRLGSHDVECFFGAMRRLSLGNEQASHAINIIVKSMILKQCTRELTLKFDIKTRVNAGGYAITPYQANENVMPIQPQALCDIAFNLMRGMPLSNDVLNTFAYQINLYSERIINDKNYPKIPNANPLIGNQATRRLILPYIVTVRPIIPSDNDLLEPISRIGENATHTSNPELNDAAIRILSASIDENQNVISQAEATVQASIEEVDTTAETVRQEEEDIPELNFIEGTEFMHLTTQGRKLIVRAAKIINDECSTIRRTIERPRNTRGVLNLTSTFGHKILELIQSCDWIDNNSLLRDKIFSPRCECIPKITASPFTFPSKPMLVSDSYDYNDMISIVTENDNHNKEYDDEYGDEEFDIFDATSPFDLVGRELFMIDS